MNISLRKASLHDVEELQKLCAETIREICRKDYSEDQLRVWMLGIMNKQRWIDKIESQFFLVAENGELLVGLGSLENGGHIDMLYTHKAYQNCGVATKIFNALEAEARHVGTAIISAAVSKSARRFFERNGFAVLETQVVTIDTTLITNYWMQKRL